MVGLYLEIVTRLSLNFYWSDIGPAQPLTGKVHTMTLMYAVLAALAVSLVSLVGVFTFLGSENLNKRIMHFLIALAAGAMLGNALLHLVPHSLSLEGEFLERNPGIVEFFHGHHNHGESDSQGHDAHEHDHATAPAKEDDHHAHDHDHDHDAHDHDHDHGHAHDDAAVGSGHQHAHDADSDSEEHHVGHSHTGLLSVFLLVAGYLGFLAIHTLMLRSHKSGEGNRMSEGWLVAFGDGVENFLDGMVIGASFLISVPAGIAATLTIFIHEIPLEAGDFAVIRHAGFSRKRALLLNFLSGLLSVVGACVTVLVGMQIPALTYLATPIAAGAFLYIAGSILIPHVREISTGDGRGFQYYSVILVGMTLMALILLLE